MNDFTPPIYLVSEVANGNSFAIVAVTLQDLFIVCPAGNIIVVSATTGWEAKNVLSHEFSNTAKKDRGTLPERFENIKVELHMYWS